MGAQVERFSERADDECLTVRLLSHSMTWSSLRFKIKWPASLLADLGLAV